ncbi:MAG: BolA/IbaG family iron-sulfur metabolism protein [Nitrospirales bacterium]
MISNEDLTMYIQQSMSDAKVSIQDRTGTMDHFNVNVVSDMFKGKNLLDRHRMIYQALDVPMKDGRIHAVELQAKTTDEV